MRFFDLPQRHDTQAWIDHAKLCVVGQALNVIACHIAATAFRFELEPLRLKPRIQTLDERLELLSRHLGQRVNVVIERRFARPLISPLCVGVNADGRELAALPQDLDLIGLSRSTRHHEAPGSALWDRIVDPID